MNLDVLLAGLEGVKSTAPDRWLARCPAHDDRSPSLSIRAVDGRILVHCFAVCEVEDVLAALDMTFADLMPDRLPGNSYKGVRPVPARDILATLDHEAGRFGRVAQRSVRNSVCCSVVPGRKAVGFDGSIRDL